MEKQNMKNKDEFAQALADIHYAVEDGMTHIYRLMADEENERKPQEPVKLLEVNTDTIATGIMPLFFGRYPDRGIDFPSVVIEVTPEEFERIKSQELKLPNGWAIDHEMPRLLAAVEAV